MDFWSQHGWLFLVFLAAFPRLTMLLAVSTPFGWLHWLGWLFAPHLLVALLATYYYWETNPLLCVGAWILGVAATFGEGFGANKACS
jgi:hypothetical protein